MSESLTQARRLIAVVELEDVRLVEVVARSGVRSREEAGKIEVVALHSARAPQGIHEGQFYVIASLEVRVTSSDAEPKRQPLTLKVEFELRYRVPPEFKATKAEIGSFAKVNGVYNAWPYFREYVQATMQRMNLPPVILPVYRIPPPPKNAATSSSGQEPPSGRSPAGRRG